MSDEPQPLRLKPRPPQGAEPPAPPAAVPPPAPGAEPGDAAARLRLKPRLTLSPDPPGQPPAEEAAPPPPAAPAPVTAPEGFKLRPKNAGTAAPAGTPPEVPALAPPPGLPTFNIPPPRTGTSMPPMSVLAPPPAPGTGPEVPAVPGSVPKLSLGGIAPGPPPVPPKPGLNIKVAADAPKKIGGKTVVKPGPGKGGVPPPAGAKKKKPELGVLAKAGIAILVLAVAVGGFSTYRIFFPAPVKEVIIKAPTAQRGPSPADVAKAQAAAAKAAADAAAVSLRLADEKAHKAAAAAAAAVPTPTPTSETPESVMVATDLTTDVKVNSTHLDAAPAASPAFRAFVASATIGGVFQGHPARALINGAIVREGQVIEEPMGIAFERIDVDRKTIFFKDTTGAEVSKNY